MVALRISGEEKRKKKMMSAGKGDPDSAISDLSCRYDRGQLLPHRLAPHSPFSKNLLELGPLAQEARISHSAE